MRSIVYAVLCLALSGCVVAGPPDDGRVAVVATTGMVADVVRNVGGDRVAVEALMGPGIDPHLYKASEGDVRRLWRTQIVFYNGLHLEARMGEVLAQMNRRVPTVAVAEGIPEASLLSPPEFEGAYDPHVWFDVRNWMIATEAVRAGLSNVDPEHAALYARNAEAYLERLRALHQYLLRRAAELPADRRVLVTAHDAFNYFGNAYGFEVQGLQGISTVSEAGTGDVQRLAQLIADRRIPAIFVETSIPLRTVEAVRAAVQARGFEVKIGGELYSDAMGAPGTPEGTYIGMVRHNMDTIVDALLGISEERT